MCAMCFETLTLFSDQNYQISQYLIVELDSCSQKEIYIIKNLLTPPPRPPPQLHRPRFQQGTKHCPISGLKEYGATQTYK